MSACGYVVRVRFAGGIPDHLEHMRDDEGVYLGKHGRWATRDKAITFESFQAGEDAMHEKWNVLRMSGDRTTILTITRID